MFKKILKWIVIIAAVGVLLYIGFIVMLMSAFGTFDKKYSKQELIDHYESHEAEIQDLKYYFQSIVPANRTVHIEFDGNSELGIFHITTFDSATGKSVRDSNWNLNIKSVKVDSMIALLGWSRETLKNIKRRLDKSGCISIANSTPFNVGFQRSGMGMYFYNLFEQPIPDTLRADYDDGCTFVLYTNKVVLEYGGGAVGPQCFPW